MSPSSSALQPLLAQFQARYPMGCLISEFLTVHQGVYAVRAVVQISNTPLATGMATASDLEAAEDRAKVRALEALAMTTLPSEKSIVPTASPSPWAARSFESVQLQPLIEPLPSSDLAPMSLTPPLSGSAEAMQGSSPLEATTPSTPSPLSEWSSPVTSLPTAAINPEGGNSPVTIAPSKTGGSVVADFYSHINADTDELSNLLNEEPEMLSFRGDRPSEETALRSLSTPLPSSGLPVKDDKPRRKSTSSPELSALTSPSVDLSDVIAQTDVELARLGWNKTQGREHLKQTYGKRSRQELDETELYDFLHYLQEQA